MKARAYRTIFLVFHSKYPTRHSNASNWNVYRNSILQLNHNQNNWILFVWVEHKKNETKNVFTFYRLFTQILVAIICCCVCYWKRRVEQKGRSMQNSRFIIHFRLICTRTSWAQCCCTFFSHIINSMEIPHLIVRSFASKMHIK